MKDKTILWAIGIGALTFFVLRAIFPVTINFPIPVIGPPPGNGVIVTP